MTKREQWMVSSVCQTSALSNSSPYLTSTVIVLMYRLVVQITSQLCTDLQGKSNRESTCVKLLCSDTVHLICWDCEQKTSSLWSQWMILRMTMPVSELRHRLMNDCRCSNLILGKGHCIIDSQHPKNGTVHLFGHVCLIGWIQYFFYYWLSWTVLICWYYLLQNSKTGAFNFVELQVLSNHGNLEFTCLYRFRVHGHIHGWWLSRSSLDNRPSYTVQNMEQWIHSVKHGGYTVLDMEQRIYWTSVPATQCKTEQWMDTL